MFRPANCLLMLALLFFISCSEVAKNEPEETAYWNTKLIDSSFRLLYKNTDTVQALQYYDSLLNLSEGITVYPKATRYAMIANYYYFFTTDNKATARMIDSALALYNTPELRNHYPRSYVGLLLFGGQIAYRLSHYTKANEYYFNAKKLGEAHLSPCERKSFNYSIAMVLYRQQNFYQSLHYFKEAYAQQATCSPQTTANILQQQEIQSNIGLCFVQLKKYDSAMAHFDQALQIAEHYKDSLGSATLEKIYGVIYGNKAQIAMAKGRLDEAEQLSLKSIALNDRVGYEQENAMSVKLQLAEVYGKKKDFVSMFGFLNSLDSSILQANSKIRLEWNRLMASYHEQTANAEVALLFSKNYFSLRDSIANDQKKLTAADVARQLKDKEQELQIAVLKKDKQITQIWLWVTVV
ncbi:MAG TPA: tetratricopeptide repeat protein, partial [Flavisolibacter sp.]|nr:tetratricopeptide repeat protein [Flavisolibacter sp.]